MGEVKKTIYEGAAPDGGDLVVEMNTGNHRYKVNGAYKPSVTKILGNFNSEDKVQRLNAWANTIGIEGVVELIQRGYVFKPDTTIWQVKAWLCEESLDLRSIQKEAQERGKAVHAALENYAKTGAVPDLAFVDERDKPYMQGLAKFLLAAKPKFLAAEVMVYSRSLDYCGTYDFRCALKRCMLVCDLDSGALREWEPGIYLGDAKTGKRIYAEASAQLGGGYELASIESGMSPTDGQFVVRFADGGYEVKPAWTTPEAFGHLVHAYRALTADKEAQKAIDKEIAELVANHKALEGAAV